MSGRPTVARVDLAALAHNYRVLAALVATRTAPSPSHPNIPPADRAAFNCAERAFAPPRAHSSPLPDSEQKPSSHEAPASPGSSTWGTRAHDAPGASPWEAAGDEGPHAPGTSRWEAPEDGVLHAMSEASRGETGDREATSHPPLPLPQGLSQGRGRGGQGGEGEGSGAPSGPGPGIIAVVKANAYGHGAARVALALEAAGAPRLACADIEEGVLLRRAGVRRPILVFGALSIGDVDGIFEYDLTPTVSTPAAVQTLERAAARRGVRLACHLKIDTGMNRLGFRHDQLDRTMPPLLASAHLAVAAAYTHFATADDPESPLFAAQAARFDGALARLRALGLGPVLRHAANSAALLRDERVWFDYVRPGLLLYGLVPPPLAATLRLKPVMALTSRIVGVKGLRPGEGVSYGMRFTTDLPRKVAVVPAGYADGLDTRLGNRGFVLVRGRRVPIIGAVSMDMLMVDVTDVDVAPGDEVVILGEQGRERMDAREMAAAIGTIPWELLCRIGTRIERVYQGGA